MTPQTPLSPGATATAPAASGVPWKRWVALLVLVVCLVIAFVNLGQWQLRRLDERRGDNAIVVAHEDAAVRPYEAVFDHPIVDADEWQRVSVTGTFLPEHQLVVRYRSNVGTVGYEVVVPLRATDGRTVLINRGFIKRPAGQDFPASVAPPPTGQVSIVGHVRRNEQGRDTAITPAGGSVMLINSDAIAAASGLTLVNGSIGVLEMTPAQQGFEPVATPPLDEGPHLSYALQWFTFSLIALVGLIVFVRNDIRDRKRALARAARAASRTDPAEAPTPTQTPTQTPTKE